MCFLCQYALLAYLEWRQARLLLENFNYVYTGRLQQLHKQTGDVIIIGSSRTGHLVPGSGIVSVSTPGSSFLAGLPFVPPALITSNAVVVIEGNNLLRGTDRPAFLNTTETLWYKTGRRFPCFAILSRPTALLVSTVQDARLNRMLKLQESAPPFDVRCQTNLAPHLATSMHPSSWDDIHLLVPAIHALQAQGVTVCIALYPQNVDLESWFPDIFPAIAEIARQTNCTVLDYYHHLDTAQLAFADKVHFVSADARTFRFRNTIARDARALRNSSITDNL